MYGTTYHRDGTITYWSVYAQMWRRRVEPESIPGEELAALGQRDRDRIRILRKGSAMPEQPFDVHITVGTAKDALGRLAEAEIVFLAGPLAGMRLVGFGIWQTRNGITITLPARQYRVNGERRSYTLLRGNRDQIDRCILDAYRDAVTREGGHDD